MSAQNAYQNDIYQSRPYLQAQPPSTQSDLKASFDDLIDEYATPYTTNSRHQSYAVGTPIPTHQRAHSIPFSKATFSSKQTDDTHDTSYTYPPPVPAKEVDTRSFWQKVLPESLACRLYVATVLVETTIDLAIEGELFLRVQEKNKQDATSAGNNNIMATSRMPVYLSIFALAHVFQFVMAVDAVYARNTLQFMCLTVFNALFLLYAIIQIKEVREYMSDSSASGVSTIPINVLTAIIPIVISIAEVAYIGLGWKIYHEFGWKVYKFLGANRRIKKLYANYQIYECLVKFDVFFWVGFSVQFIWLVLQDTDWEYYVTFAALPLSIALLVEGHLAARHENKWMMATFMMGCVGAMIYFIYKLIKVLLFNQSSQYRLVWKSLTVFSVIAIALLFATFVFSVVILRNFGRGLKEALTRKAQGFGGPPHRRAASATLNRMSID